MAEAPFRSSTILVHGTEGLNKETLEMFFENKKRSEGGDIKHIHEYKQCGMVAITFEKEEVARRVKEKGNFTCQKKSLKADYNQHLKTIQIHGLPSTLPQDKLELYFESPRKTQGGPIDTVEYHDPEAGIAVITFETEDVANRLLSLEKPLQLENATLMISPRTLFIDPKMISVIGIDEKTEEENLMMFFESKSMSGGGEIETLDFKKKTRKAVIKYAEEEVAQRVLQQKVIKMKGADLKVGPFIPNIGKVAAADHKEEDGEETEEDTSTIYVEGINSSTTDDTLTMFFENKRKCGGGEITSMEFDDKKGRARITFAEENVVKNVLHHKGDIVLEGARLTVSQKPPADPVLDGDDGCDRRAVFIEKISPQTNESTLEMLFENEIRSGGGEIEELHFNQKEHTCVVLFKEAAIAERVLKKGSMDLDGAKLQVSPSKEPPDDIDGSDHSRRIRVTGIDEQTTEDELTLFFEHNKYSGGGPIQKIDFNQTKRSAVIQFKDQSSMKNIYKLV